MKTAEQIASCSPRAVRLFDAHRTWLRLTLVRPRTCLPRRYDELRPELRELLLSTFLWHLQNPPAQLTLRVKPQELKNVIHACATMRQPLSDALLQVSRTRTPQQPLQTHGIRIK